MKKTLILPLGFLAALSSISCDDAAAIRSVKDLTSAPRATANDSGDEIFGDGMEGKGKYCCAASGASCISWCERK